MIECETQPRHWIPHQLAVIGIAGIALLSASCSAGDAPSDPPPEARAPTTEPQANEQPEQTALSILSQSNPENRPYVWRGLAMISSGTLYYDAPIDPHPSITRAVPEGEVMAIDQPRILVDTDSGVNWFAFTLSKGGSRGLANNPDLTYWLPLDPAYQLGNPEAISGKSAVYQYPDADPKAQCLTMKDTIVTATGNLALADEPSTLVATGSAMPLAAFDNLVQQKGLVAC